MNDLTAADFTEFFSDIHGHPPFPWQSRLTAEVLETGEWPEVIDLPTGSGKTAVLDTAIFSLAARPDVSPRRVVFVIDRRIVVDQVHKRAQCIQKRIQDGNTPMLALIRERLSTLSDGDGDLIGVAALRGGIPIDDNWTHRPDMPSCIVSTVDQFGSKLLFRGYGVSPGMRPIHAGLAGNDCLVILDEVHLSVPFSQTLSGIASLPSGKLARRFQVVEMSATPSNPQATRFTLNAADTAESEELRRRVRARKTAKLVPVGSPSKPPHEVIPREVLRIAKKELSDRVQSVGVIVNRVRTARETHRALSDAGYSAHLITGRMRPLDRVAKLDALVGVVEPDPDQRTDMEHLTFVVSTQAIEVGADFSFDALITECAAIDSLKQRFGRLDRRGVLSAVPENDEEDFSPLFALEDAGFSDVSPSAPSPADPSAATNTAAQSWILGPKSVVASKKPDPIYGESVKATWNELEIRSFDGALDVGPLSLQDFPEDAYAPRNDAPLLLKTHIDAWAQTNPEPIVQPSVECFLHGLEQPSNSDVSIVWRWDRSSEVLRLVPPRQAEFLQIPIQAAKSWLSGEPEAPVADINLTQVDISANGAADSLKSSGWVRWDGFQDGPKRIRVSEIKPGDIIIVSPQKGGLSGETWNPGSKQEVSDLGDAAQLAYGKRATLRLHSKLFANKRSDSSPTPTEESKADTSPGDGDRNGAGDPPTPAEENEADTSPRERIKEWLDGQAELPEWATEVLKRLDLAKCELHHVGINEEDPKAGYYVLAEKKVDAGALDGSDLSGSLTGTGVKLGSHLEGVGDRAKRFAASLGLSEETQEDLRLAGRLHDLGKVDTRFQALLVGGDPVALALQDEPLAKSKPGTPKNRPPEDLKYPKGMRHEIASVAMIESNEDVLAEAHDRDLVLHLVGTHHGHGRPLPPVVEDLNPQPLSYELDGIRMQTSSDVL